MMIRARRYSAITYHVYLQRLNSPTPVAAIIVIYLRFRRITKAAALFYHARAYTRLRCLLSYLLIIRT